MDPALYAYPDVDRPWVRVNFVATVDGSAQDDEGVSGTLGGDADHEVFTLLRDLADVVLVSAGTARAEGYGPGEDVVVAVVSRSLDLPDTLRVPGVLAITPADADADAVRSLEGSGVEVLRSGTDQVHWPSVLDELGGRGLRRILCEGGPTLFAELSEQDLVDDLCLTIAPVLVAGPGQRIAHGEHTLRRDLTLAHAVEVDGVLLTRWVRDR